MPARTRSPRVLSFAPMAITGLLTLALARPAVAYTTGQITEFGETAGKRHPITPPDDGGNGLAPAYELENMTYISHADTLEAALCRGFGATLTMSAPLGELLPERLETRIFHPKLTRPEDGATSVEDDFPTYAPDGSTHAGFTFDHEWEMQPGTWTIAFYFDGVELARKSFTITLPPGPPPSVCEKPVS